MIVPIARLPTSSSHSDHLACSKLVLSQGLYGCKRCIVKLRASAPHGRPQERPGGCQQEDALSSGYERFSLHAGDARWGRRRRCLCLCVVRKSKSDDAVTVLIAEQQTRVEQALDPLFAKLDGMPSGLMETT